MPRTLPWLVETSEKKATSSRASAAPIKRKRSPSPGDLVDEDLNATSAAVPFPRRNIRLDRTPSTSPPPAPPDVEFMKEGTEHDDGWIMVEDEFYATAQMFTKHIHHAEYVRLKRLAKSRGSETLQNISRPTDGRTARSFEQRQRQEATDKDKQVAEALQRVAGQEEEGESDDDMLLDPQLTGLMSKSQRTNDDLSALVKSKANTRAAAGFSQSPRKAGRDHARRHFDRLTESGPSIKKESGVEKFSEEDEDTDSEDLDAIPSKVSKTQVRYESSSMLEKPKAAVTETHDRYAKTSLNGNKGQPGIKSEDVSSYRPKQTSPTVKKENHRRSSSIDVPPYEHRSIFGSSSPTFDGAGESNMRRSTTGGSSYLARKRAAQEDKGQKGKQKATEVDDIPTWLG